MKHFPVLVAAAFLSLACATKTAQKPPLIHATYSVLSRIVPEELFPERQQDYDFHYLQAMPYWRPEEFDAPLQDILKAKVDTHRYERQATLDAYLEVVHKAGRKVYLSWSGGRFIGIATDPARRAKFARYTACFARHHGFDGLELDWEGTVTKELHMALIGEMRAALDSLGALDGRRYGLTTALNSEHNYSQAEADSLSALLDWVNIMYYDMGGGYWARRCTHNTPLPDIQANYESNWSRFDPKKIHIGLASYGYRYDGIMPGEEVPEGHKMSEYAQDFFVRDLPALREAGWTESWDSTARCPYYFAPDSSAFVTADNEESLEEKLAWVREKGFGGIFWWEYHCDFIPAQGKHVLMDYVVGRISQPETTSP